MRLLEQARLDAETFRAATEAECVELKETAKKEGYQEGLEQLNANIIGLDQEKKRLRHEMNKLILPLALKAAKKIVAKELEINPETIVDIVLQALSPVLQNHHITIWVNKADKEILEDEKLASKKNSNKSKAFPSKKEMMSPKADASSKQSRASSMPH